MLANNKITLSSETEFWKFYILTEPKLPKTCKDFHYEIRVDWEDVNKCGTALVRCVSIGRSTNLMD